MYVIAPAALSTAIPSVAKLRGSLKVLAVLSMYLLMTNIAPKAPVTIPVSQSDSSAEIELDPAPDSETVEPIPGAPDLPEQPVPVPVETNTFPQQLEICGTMTISNRPGQLDELRNSNYAPLVEINGVSLAVAPVQAACFSSGFGPRGSSLHKGLDLHNSDPVDIYAAADGVVRRKQYRDDYGNMIVLDHGDGVFTRYAHLESFNAGLALDGTVKAGDQIGIMGNTASYRIPRHLHYEVLTGEWGALSGSFGLEPVDLIAQLPEN